jgi:hypothetical protein
MDQYPSDDQLPLPVRRLQALGIGRESGLSAIHEYLQEESVWIDTVGEVPNPLVMR